jgi:NADH-quinone oxidoreductase subunit C/D
MAPGVGEVSFDMHDNLKKNTLAEIQAHFEGEILVDEREGCEGFLVPPDRLADFATAARDELGYDYLSSVTGVDYLPENKMEAVYHLYRSQGGPALVVKTQMPRENPSVPSLVSVYPGADFQEREAWDLLGIRFEGHPNLKRILMWEGFQGHPLRKDWHEPYYEEDSKPFKSRWPEGNVIRIEDHVPYHKNVQYPEDFSAETWIPEGDAGLYAGLARVPEKQGGNGRPLKTDQIVVNLGPQHPSTHGVFRMVVTLDGETIVDLQPVMGYLHRNHEKIAERNTYIMNMPFTDRLNTFV